MQETSPVVLGAVASLLAGLATGLGAIPILMTVRVSAKMQDALLGFGAGVMLSASFFSLILPALEAAQAEGAGRSLAATIVVLGILIGAGTLAILNRVIPHEHFFTGREGRDTRVLARIWLFVIAITLHNFPEGLAVGVGFGGGNVENGTALAIGIGLQNLPEGLAVAVALLTQHYSRGYAFAVAFATGLVEPVGGLLGAGVVTLARDLLPWGMAFAAGAMIFVISSEIIPETHRRGFQHAGTTGLMIGMVLMLYLDVILG
ncbi:ZIP family metal transporter [Ferruginivarius sediminum]|uniref:ZIP family metal transporter n=1 Tax=Ferruginivarius sediminum TaxID=2661937 RepID=A0A369TAE0_9PROT|nr:ZIP family metal transporter [Ferruginivarius sediminum]